jgi:hypothetical protein
MKDLEERRGRERGRRGERGERGEKKDEQAVSARVLESREKEEKETGGREDAYSAVREDDLRRSSDESRLGDDLDSLGGGGGGLERVGERLEGEDGLEGRHRR